MLHKMKQMTAPEPELTAPHTARINFAQSAANALCLNQWRERDIIWQSL